MTETILIDIGNLFINFMAYGCSIAVVMYFISWIAYFLLGLVFPKHFGRGD